MKTKLKQNGGFAIVSVIFLLMVLSLMGTAMYLYCVTSLRSVRFLSDRKKAEYLAQAGIEASSYAYELAVYSSAGDNSVSAAVDLINETNHVDAVINVDRVYLVYDRSESDNNHYKYVSSTSGYADSDIVGYFDGKITTKKSLSYNKIKEATATTGTSNYTPYEYQMSDDQRFFECTGHAHNSNAAATKKAYISEPVYGKGNFYDKDTGVIYTCANSKIVDKIVTDNNGTNHTIKADSTHKKGSEFINQMSVIGKYNWSSDLTINISLFNNLGWFGRLLGLGYTDTWTINVGSKTVPIFMGYSAGNMILSKPDNVNEISFENNATKTDLKTDNYVSFAAKGNLFVETGIDATPEKGFFNTLYLRGNTIVVDGDIELYIYGFKQSFFQRISNIQTLVQENYALGTVVIGVADTESATGYSSTALNDNSCSKIFFSGNVFVNMQIPNVGTYRYRAFKAGDAYYFNNDLPAFTGGENGYGIDLLKYFMDESIATKKYSDNVLTRMAEALALYYTSSGKTPTAYVTMDDNGNYVNHSMEKIDKTDYAALIPPSPTSSTLKWDTP